MRILRRERKLLLAALVAGLGSLVASSASAIDINGETLPIVPNTHDDCESDVWFCVNEHETGLGYTGAEIDILQTATIDQETFNPLCNLTFEVVYHGASYLNVFGWYEVQWDDQGNPVAPDPSEMHVMLGCDVPIGEVVNLPAPDGVTEIGFFLANDHANDCVANSDGTLKDTQENLFFSQPELNQDDGRVHLLIWQSRANPTAFYFGWEDQYNGGDNDFEDLLTYVTGIQCSGGGELCETGDDGICAQGIMQCRDGQLTCVPLQEPRDESCNAIDDDCDGSIDNGDLCDANEVCYQGRCQPKCGGGEFKCSLDLVCGDAGVCIERACLDVECDTGEVCRDGDCVGACDDVVCPHGQSCRAGVCVDVCEGVECDEGFTCQVTFPNGPDDEPVGLCSSCGCTGCEGGFTCTENLCVEDECVDMTCNDGFRCEAGTCVDNCAGADCPADMLCEAGQCVPDPNGSAPGEGGASGDGGGGGTLSLGGQTTTGTTQGSVGANGGTAATGSSGLGGPGNVVEAKGCSCRMTSRGQGASWLLLLPLGLLLARRRPDERSLRE